MENISDLEKVILTAKTTNNFIPVWELFVNTEFYVSVHSDDEGKIENFEFVVVNDSQNPGTPSVVVSEVMERLKNPHSDKAIKMTAAKLIQILSPECSMMIALSEGGFGLPVKLVEWLRASLQTQ